MKIAVIGSGRMGSFFARYFMSNDHEVYVYDRDKGKMDILLKEGAEEISLDQLRGMDLVMIAVSLEHTRSVIRDIARYMRSNATLVEISSIKQGVYNILKMIHKRYNINPLSIHPLFGQGIRSLESARIILIPVINPIQEHDLAKKLFLNARIIEMDQREHDRSMAIILGLTHLTNLVIAKVILEEDYAKLKEIGGTTYRLQSILVESIMNDDPNLSIALLLLNRFMKRYAKRFMKEVEHTCNAIINGDAKYLLNSYKATRDRLAKKSNIEESYRLMYTILEELNNK